MKEKWTLQNNFLLRKEARGRMADYIIRQRIQTIEDLYQFDADGYRYAPEVSTKQQPVFRRAAADAN